MDKLTAQIISVCRHPDEFDKIREMESYRDAVIALLQVKFGDPEYWASPKGQEAVDRIIREAAMDYLDGCEKPSEFVKDIILFNDLTRIFNESNPQKPKRNYCDAILSAFVFAVDRYGDKYMNGFTKENTKIVKPSDFDY